MECVPGTPFMDGRQRALPGGQPWWRVRDDIEGAMGVRASRESRSHVRRATKANPQGTYLVGYRVHPDDSTVGDQLTSNDVLRAGECVAVKRQPVDADTLREHSRSQQAARAPPANSAEWARMTEDERLDAVLNMGPQVYLGDVVAARERARTAPAPAEDAGATCRACGRRGHSERWCPHKLVRGFVPLWRRRAPSGIPKHRLRKAREEEYDHAFLTLDGQLVVDGEACRMQQETPTLHQ